MLFLDVFILRADISRNSQKYHCCLEVGFQQASLLTCLQISGIIPPKIKKSHFLTEVECKRKEEWEELPLIYQNAPWLLLWA